MHQETNHSESHHRNSRDEDRDSTARMIACIEHVQALFSRATDDLFSALVEIDPEQIEIFAPLHKKLDGMTASVFITKDGERYHFSTVLSRGVSSTLFQQAHLSPQSSKETATTGYFSFESQGRTHCYEIAHGPSLDDWVILRRLANEQLEPEQVFQTLYSPAPESFLHMNDPLVHKARELAREDFKDTSRKVPKGSNLAPDGYFTHVHAVATVLAEYGYDAEVIAAGYLHDHIEDLSPRYSKEVLSKLFSPRVAELVDWVTQQDKGLTWEERNERYNERIKDAPEEALALSAADKLSNVLDIIPFLKMDYPVDAILKRGWQVNSDKFHDLLALYKDKIPEGLYSRLEAAVSIFDQLGSALQHKEGKS